MSDRISTLEHSRRSKLDTQLDQALGHTFPASDPFSIGRITGTEPASQPTDRKAPRIAPQEGRQRRPRKRQRSI